MSTTKTGKPQRTPDKTVTTSTKTLQTLQVLNTVSWSVWSFPLRAKEIWATEVRQRAVYTAIIPVFTTHSHGGVCVDSSAGSAAPTAASIFMLLVFHSNVLARAQQNA